MARLEQTVQKGKKRIDEIDRIISRLYAVFWNILSRVGNGDNQIVWSFGNTDPKNSVLIEEFYGIVNKIYPYLLASLSVLVNS